MSHKAPPRVGPKAFQTIPSATKFDPSKLPKEPTKHIMNGGKRTNISTVPVEKPLHISTPAGIREQYSPPHPEGPRKNEQISFRPQPPPPSSEDSNSEEDLPELQRSMSFLNERFTAESEQLPLEPPELVRTKKERKVKDPDAPKKPKKDPDAPKRALSGWQLFIKEAGAFPEIKALPGKERITAISKLWQAKKAENLPKLEPVAE
jgi:hypothetical protein